MAGNLWPLSETRLDFRSCPSCHCWLQCNVPFPGPCAFGLWNGALKIQCFYIKRLWINPKLDFLIWSLLLADLACRITANNVRKSTPHTSTNNDRMTLLNTEIQSTLHSIVVWWHNQVSTIVHSIVVENLQSFNLRACKANTFTFSVRIVFRGSKFWG